MDFTFHCPQCSARFKVADKLAGKRAKCPRCGSVITLSVPMPDVVESIASSNDDVPQYPSSGSDLGSSHHRAFLFAVGFVLLSIMVGMVLIYHYVASPAIDAVRKSRNGFVTDGGIETSSDTSEVRRTIDTDRPWNDYRIEWLRHGFLLEPKEMDYLDRTLNLRFLVRTKPGMLVKELYGHVAILKDGRIVHEADIAEKKDISSADSVYVFLSIDYNDDDPNHRILRTADVDELDLRLDLHRIVYADGTEERF